MCLTVESDLLDTDSTEEEFDGSWKVRARARANQASRLIRSKWGPLGEIFIARRERRPKYGRDDPKLENW
jgi:hypothetical protein